MKYIVNDLLKDLFNNTITLTSLELILDLLRTTSRVTSFIQQEVIRTTTNGVVLGLSGGIDSSVAASLATRALGNKNVLGLILPDKTVTSSIDIKDAARLSNILGIQYNVIDITDIKESYTRLLPKDRLSIGNLTARIRMNIIYYYANFFNRLVLGPSDRSELELGYFTKFGDGAADILPLGDLYKTEVRQLGEYLGIPKSILSKRSSPSLWKGQTAESELGIKYETIDKILKFLDNKTTNKKSKKKTVHSLKQFNFNEKDLFHIKKLVSRNKHKRKLPRICLIR